MDQSQMGVIIIMLGGLMLILTIFDETREIDRNGKSWKWKRPVGHNTFIMLSIVMLVIGNIVAWGA